MARPTITVTEYPLVIVNVCCAFRSNDKSNNNNNNNSCDFISKDKHNFIAMITT